MQALLVALAALLAAVLVLLASPLTLTLEIERVDRWSARWRARWAFGLIGGRSGAWTRRPRPARKTPRRGRARSGGARGLAVVRTRGLVARVGRLLVDLARRVHCEELAVQVAYGFDDPADTGRIYGALMPLLLTASAAGWNVRCEPRFTERCLQGTGSTRLRVTPLAVLATLAAFLFSPPVLRAAWAAARA